MENKYPVPDEPLMQKISSETGGKYYRATSAAVLQGIYQQIDKLEKSKVDVITKTNIHELFHWFVLAALFFLLLELLLKYTLRFTNQQAAGILLRMKKANSGMQGSKAS
jgi:Ca-activated chloride channel family protein